MRTISRLLIFLLLPTLPLAAEAPELRGRVFWVDEDGDKQHVRQAVVRVEETRKTTTSDDTGYFRFVFSETFGSGHRVPLVVEKEGWVIRHPPGGEVETQLPADPKRALIDIELVPKGSELLLAHDQLKALIERTARESKALAQ